MADYNNVHRYRSTGEAVKSRRLELHMTQDNLGEAIGCSRSTISRIENNNRFPSRFIIEKLAKAMDCNPLYLVGIVDKADGTEWTPVGSVIGE